LAAQVTQGYIDFIERTATEHLKLLLDTGILQTPAVDFMVEEVAIEEGEEVPSPTTTLCPAL
jgi:hypothetical protein